MRRCNRCGAVPTDVLTLLDSRNGKKVRIVRCELRATGLVRRRIGQRLLSLRTKLRNGQPGDLFWLVRASGIYLDDFAADDFADGIVPVDQVEET